MDVSSALAHVVSLLWPALFVAAGLALPLSWRQRLPWWRQWLTLAALGSAVLIAAWWIQQRDGLMSTYALMLLVQASWAWWIARR